jgi:2-C-methyl-D-erythritol 4-phosphate cytidylyltransferase
MTSAIIVAAGKGTRMGLNADKLFVEVAGRPVIAHTWQRFESAACIDEIVLVIRDGMQDAFGDLAERFGYQKKFRLVAGGKERQDSVWNGLQCIAAEAEIVAIQDGARPCTSEAIIANTVRAAREGGAAVAAQRVTDTIKEADRAGFIRRNVDRSRLWSVQARRAFRSNNP